MLLLASTVYQAAPLPLHGPGSRTPDSGPIETMSDPTFNQLNHGWNAEPNSPEPVVEVEGTTARLSFFLNPFQFEAGEEEVALLIFTGTRQWRLGATNDEGWYRGQCRYSSIAPKWGEFYEIVGDDPLRSAPLGWLRTVTGGWDGRHFLFYLRDETFECIADWSLQRGFSSAIVKDES